MNDRIRELGIALRANDLLSQYQSSATLFASRRQTLLADGVRAELSVCADNHLVEAATTLLSQARRDGVREPRLLGAVPFRSDASARLILPARCLVGQGVDDTISPIAAPMTQCVGKTQMMPPLGSYQHNVARALGSIAAQDFEKVVLSRALALQAKVDIPSLLRRLVSRNAHGYTFAVNLDQHRYLVGASPELLLSRYGREVISQPLAGSIPRSADPIEDAKRAEGLLHSAKDRHEHALVVDAVADSLRPYCENLHVPAAPSLHATPTMWHLGTKVCGDLIDPTHSSLALALALHPTPAVCGFPTNAARDFIAAVEGFDRGYFAGLVGWCDAEGDGEWAVTIRCAEIGVDSATLYAGAGIVAGSEPELEFAETSAKLRTMLLAMGLEAALEA
ncbi:isochorismate synthase [Chitinimonas sp. BJB300]|uniref:isochorismate synthase n=1 Tax=Chitinimonas sp. BJB300 TaxID=1559339 RepID=UPI000C0DFEB8|nr:isochorismate synthase [Chitinimonas sp. BJB300]PHV11870.1 Isochorismate synthase [Chitinimonas sp. BJB300]TSJ87769.1 isochorismate synthase [Chitinimonas sp. BJB300]